MVWGVRMGIGMVGADPGADCSYAVAPPPGLRSQFDAVGGFDSRDGLGHRRDSHHDIRGSRFANGRVTSNSFRATFRQMRSQLSERSAAEPAISLE